MEPALSSSPNGVMFVGEALGVQEADEGRPFVGAAGHRLTRLIEWAGFSRGDFDVINAIWCRPPDNRLEGMAFEGGAIAHCRHHHWGGLLGRARVLVPLGNVATNALIGRKSILTNRGYVWPGPSGQHVIPTVHPSFIQRGQAKWSAAFINDIQKAVTLANTGLPSEFTTYSLDPSPAEALHWAQRYREHLLREPVKLAFDIETPGKGEDEDGVDLGDAPDRTWTIERIGFAYQPLEALSIPWSPPYMAAVRLLLESEGEKVVWNAGFDVPRLVHAGVRVHGLIHDGMVAWHILHSDLPKRLGFVATFTCPWQPAWKHLSGSRPAFYNATDADVELRSMLAIEAELRRVGLWEVYQRDVLDLDPILVYMSEKGMPVDADIRLDRALKLAAELDRLSGEMEKAVPIGARKIARTYARPPADTRGLLVTQRSVRENFCSLCGVQRPRKPHFRKLKKKHNPCSDGTVLYREVSTAVYHRLTPFTPSRDQLSRYHQVKKRPLPMVWDKKERRKKVSFGEEQLKQLMLKYPDDPLYPLILAYREADKLAGTYVGRPVQSQEGG